MDHLPRSHVTNLIVCKKQLACSNAAMASAAAQAIAVATAVSGDSLRWAPCDSTDFKGVFSKPSGKMILDPIIFVFGVKGGFFSECAM